MAAEPIAPRPGAGPGDLVVCSLEPWDDVWRRNQFFVDEFLRRDPALRVLFVERTVDVLLELSKKRFPKPAKVRRASDDGRLLAMPPNKYLPHLLAGDFEDRRIDNVVKRAAKRLGLKDPLLWVNDPHYCGLAQDVDWPVVYDVTDDWQEAGGSERSVSRLRKMETELIERAEEVVVVSQSLAASRGAKRPVQIIGCGVVVEDFRRPQPRPSDLPSGETAVYVGSLQATRLDIELCLSTAKAIAPAVLVFVGPSFLGHAETEQLSQAGCLLLGPRPYSQVPAYYQHADIIVVPHNVNSFTESLDPIKGYECMASGRPTLCTPVAGMRDLGPPIESCDSFEFPARAKKILTEHRPTVHVSTVPTWSDRTDAFGLVMASARAKRAGKVPPAT